MQDDPSGSALLDIACRTLMEEIVPNLEGRKRFLSLMIANAMRIAAREIDGAARAAQTREQVLDLANVESNGPEAAARLVGAIRAGQLDADPTLYEALSQAAIIAVSMSKPAFLAAEERLAIDPELGSGTAAGRIA